VRRRWVLWVLLALPLGCAAYGFAYFNRPTVAYRRALKALGQDDFDTARYELLRLRGLPEFDPHASLINGILLLQEQKVDNALEEFRLASDHTDTRVLALTLAGRTLLGQRQFVRGERALLMALQYDPNMAEAHFALGAAYCDFGDFRRSLMHLEKAAELAPPDPRPYQLMAEIHQKFGKDELAIKDLREFLRRGTDSARLSPRARQNALLDMAQLQSKLLRPQEAIDTLKDVEESADSLAVLAESQFASGNLEAARDYVDRALRLDPDEFEALVLHGRLAMEAKDATSALDSLNRALRLRPRNPALHHLLSQVLHAEGRDDLAEKHTKEHEYLGELTGEYDELLGSARDEPWNALTCYRLGLLAERLGMENEAAGWYRAVLLVDPGHLNARNHLSNLPGGVAHVGVQP